MTLRHTPYYAVKSKHIKGKHNVRDTGRDVPLLEAMARHEDEDDAQSSSSNCSHRDSHGSSAVDHPSNVRLADTAKFHGVVFAESNERQDRIGLVLVRAEEVATDGKR